MKKNNNNKKRRYRRYFLFAAAIICLIILINIGLIYAQDGKNTAVADRGEAIVTIERGAGELQLAEPSAIAVDSAENILICDSGSRKVLRINADKLSVSRCFSFAGTEIGNNYVSDAAISKSGFVYLADAEKNVVHKFTENGSYAGAIGRSKDKKLISKIKFIFTDNSSNLIVVDSIDHKILVFDERMDMTREIRIPLSKMIFSYVCGSDDSGGVYISSLKDNVFSVMNAADIERPIYSEKCSPEYKNAKIADCQVIGFDNKNNAYVKAYLVDKNGKEIAHYLVKFDREKKSYTKKRIAFERGENGVKILKPFIVLSENKVLSYEDTEKAFKLIVYKFKD